MERDILYENGRLKITYLHSPEPAEESKVISTEDHEIWIKGVDEEWNRYIIQRGILKELAHTAKEKPINLIDKLYNLNIGILCGMDNGQITLKDIKQAFICAYQKEEDNFDRYLAEQEL